MLQVVLDVLGAMIELVEALACQRLALAPFTRSGARAAGAGGVTTVSGGGGGAGLSGGLLRVSGHCYSVWAKPLHPVWLEVRPASAVCVRLGRGGCRSPQQAAASLWQSMLLLLRLLFWKCLCSSKRVCVWVLVRVVHPSLPSEASTSTRKVGCCSLVIACTQAHSCKCASTGCA